MTKRKSAFTLIEMLVALAITAVLVVLLVNVVSAALTIWEQGRNQIDTFANARQVLGRIADEISGAIAAPSPQPVEFSENLTTSSFRNGGPTPTPNPQPTPQPNKSENIFFVASYPNVQAGDLCVIAYRHIDIDLSQGNNSHTLQRALVDSQSAWNGGAASRYQSSGYASFDWRTVARGVLEFEIQSYSQADLDSTVSPSPAPTASWASTSVDPIMTGNTPRQVVVRIKVVDDRTLAKLAGLSPGNPTYDRLVNRAARQFTASVMLRPPH